MDSTFIKYFEVIQPIKFNLKSQYATSISKEKLRHNKLVYFHRNELPTETRKKFKMIITDFLLGHNSIFFRF